MAPSPGAANDADLSQRRAWLLRNVATKTFGPGDISSLIKSPYREELAISSLSMTTVALTNLAFRRPQDVAASRDAVRVMLDRMLSEDVRRYDVLWWGEDALTSLGGEKGHAGYLGHLNLMLGCYFLLGGDDEDLRRLGRRVSDTLARRIEASGVLHIESFPGRIYTADNVVVVLSLRLHDLAGEPRYGELINRWLGFVRERLVDADGGMLRYYVTSTGAAGTSRGVLQAWNSMWLPLIDEPFARDQYARMKRQILSRSAVGNFTAVREYPQGQPGPTDLVSGPLMFGLSPTATAFAMGGAAYWQDDETLTGLLRTAELAGSSVSFNGRRRYLFAPLTGEAIILAARTMTRWDDRYSNRH